MTSFLDEIYCLENGVDFTKPMPIQEFCMHVDNIMQLRKNNSDESEDVLLSKGFRLEIFPFASYLKIYSPKGSDDKCFWNNGNQNYDAVLEDKNGDKTFFEITLANESSEDFNLRNQEIKLRGHTIVNMPPAVKKIGHREYVLTERDFSIPRDQEDAVSKLLDYLLVALKRKLNKLYPKDTKFIIHFSPLDYFDNFKDNETLKQKFMKKLDEAGISLDRDVYFIGHFELRHFSITVEN